MPILKEHGLDMLDRHKDGFIGMHRACWGQEQRHTDTVEAFLKAGASFEACPSTQSSRNVREVSLVTAQQVYRTTTLTTMERRLSS